jgi:hypothetical protein
VISIAPLFENGGKCTSLPDSPGSGNFQKVHHGKTIRSGDGGGAKGTQLDVTLRSER